MKNSFEISKMNQFAVSTWKNVEVYIMIEFDSRNGIHEIDGADILRKAQTFDMSS